MHANITRRRSIGNCSRALSLAGVLAGGGLIGTGLVAVLAPAGALAQTQSLPGIVIAPSPGPSSLPPGGIPGVMISPGPGSMAPPPPAQPQPPQQPPAAAPKPKPKAKVVAKPREDAGTGNGDGDGLGKGPGTTRISLLVNGDPITAYEIEQRARLMALGADIQSKAQAKMKELATSESVNARWKKIVQDTVMANQTKTREQIMAILQERQKAFSMDLQKQAITFARSSSIPAKRAEARKELIEEQIKLQDARRNGAAPDESMVEDLIKDLANRNKMSPVEFARHFAGMGVDVNTLKARYRAQLAWTDSVRKQYGHLAQPSQRELDRALVGFTGGEDQVELQLQRIVVSVPPKVDQKVITQRLAEAEQLQRQFTEMQQKQPSSSCRGTAVLAGRIKDARHEELGVRNATSFTEPSRTMLLNASEGTMLPPTMTSSGIELLAVCGRRVIKAAEKKRSELANQRRQEEFERIARNHLRKLMDNAVIENR